MQAVAVGEMVIGAGALGLIAGPCVIESLELCQRVAEHMTRLCQRLGVPYIFKASFDKANRTAHESFRGRGLEEGLEVLTRIRREFGVPVTTDIHESWQAEPRRAGGGLAADPCVFVSADRFAGGGGAHGQARECQKGAVPRAVGRGQHRGQVAGVRRVGRAAD
jgi:hypothetical protein